MERKIRLTIGGMTCVNCRNKIENALTHTDGVIRARVSERNGTADIAYDEEIISRGRLISVIEALGYEVLPEGNTAAPSLPTILCMLAVIVLLYTVLQSTGVLNRLVPSRLADTTMGYAMLFVIGLLTSVHCIAMCGGINLLQCIPREDSRSGRAAFRPALAYNVGRVLSYTAIGFVLGLVGFVIGGGTGVALSALLQGILKLIAGLFMVVMGINMLGLFPGLRRISIRVPQRLARTIGSKRTETNRPFFVGLLNGLMPCGPLQSMWIVALAAGNPFAGAASMLLFSLGTVPLMLGLGSVVSALGKKFAHQVMTVGAILVVVLGLAMLSQGGSLSGLLPPELLRILLIALCAAAVLLHIPVEKAAVRNLLRAAAAVVVVGSYGVWSVWGTPVLQRSDSEAVDEVQVIHSTLSPGQYPDITVRAGVPVKWVIDAPEGSVNGCNGRMLIPDYELEYTFQTGENIIEFTPEQTGTVPYHCWMGMIQGNIYVMDETTDALSADQEGTG